MERTIVAVVQKVLAGKHGQYVVARAKEVTGTITFSLSRDVWQDDARPEPGLEVMLGDVRRKRAGWRAYNARFRRLSDDERQAAQQQSAK